MKFKKVLLVEDDSLHLETIKEKLEEKGYNCVPCQTKEDAEKLILKEDFDWALLDIDLKQHRYGGIDIAKQLHKKKVIPIILLTGRGDDDHYYNKYENESPLAHWVDKFIKSEFFNMDIPLLKIEKFLTDVEKKRYNIHLPSGGSLEVINHEKHSICFTNIIYVKKKQGFDFPSVFTDLQDEPFNAIRKSTLDEQFGKVGDVNCVPNHPLLRIHRLYVVNMYKILKMNPRKSILYKKREAHIILKDYNNKRLPLPLSRDKATKIRNFYNDQKPLPPL